MDGNSEFAKPPQSGRRWWIIAFASALVIAAIVWLVRALLPGVPQIQEVDLAAAMKRWDANEVRDYDLTVVVSGRRSAEIKTTIRNGKPTSMIYNGREMKEERTWRPWTVPGLFETIETDFDNAASPAEKYGGAGVRVVLRAEFDEQYGLPRRYLQQVFGQMDDLSWTVTEFKPLATP